MRSVRQEQNQRLVCLGTDDCSGVDICSGRNAYINGSLGYEGLATSCNAQSYSNRGVSVDFNRNDSDEIWVGLASMLV